MNLLRLRAAVVSAMFLVAGLSACERKEAVTIAQLLDEPTAYDGRFIEVNACMDATRHAMTLVDCVNPRVHVALDFSSVLEDPDTKKLLEQGYKTWSPTSRRLIPVTVEGRYEWITPRDGHRLEVSRVIAVHNNGS